MKQTINRATACGNPLDREYRNDFQNHIGDTVRVLRPPPRVFTSPEGKNVWMGDVEPCELELDDPGPADPYNSNPVVDNPWAGVKRL